MVNWWSPGGWFGGAAARKPETPPAPGVSKGLAAWLRARLGGPGPGPAQYLIEPKAAGGPRGINLPRFLPYFDDVTGESPGAREAYRRMLASPDVKSALLGKLLAVAALDLHVQPASKSPRDASVAEFVKWALTRRLQGCVPGLIWSVLSGGCVDGYSVSEKVWAKQSRGRWAGKWALQALKPQQVGEDLVLEIDPFKNVVGLLGLRYNAGLTFSPADFLIYRHLPFYGSPTGMSDFRAIYGSYWMLDTCKKLRMIGVEKFSLPLLVGHYADGRPDSKASLEASLRLAKSQNWLSAPESARVEALNIAGSAHQIFEATVRDLKHDIFLGVANALLQQLEGTTTDGRGDSQVHRSSADLLVWYLAASVQTLLNDEDTGLIKDLVDLNFAVSEYPHCTLSAVDPNEQLQELKIDQGLAQIGVPLSLEEAYERYGRTPPKDESDRLAGPAPPQPQPGGAPGEPGEPPQPGKPGKPPGGPQPPASPGKPGEPAERFAEHDVTGEARDEGGKWTAGGGEEGPSKAHQRPITIRRDEAGGGDFTVRVGQTVAVHSVMAGAKGKVTHGVVTGISPDGKMVRVRSEGTNPNKQGTWQHAPSLYPDRRPPKQSGKVKLSKALGGLGGEPPGGWGDADKVAFAEHTIDAEHGRGAALRVARAAVRLLGGAAAEGFAEHDVSGESRDSDGKWTAGGGAPGGAGKAAAGVTPREAVQAAWDGAARISDEHLAAALAHLDTLGADDLTATLAKMGFRPAKKSVKGMREQVRGLITARYNSARRVDAAGDLAGGKTKFFRREGFAEHDVTGEARDAGGKWTAGGNSGKTTPRDLTTP